MPRIEMICSICNEEHTAAGAVVTFGCIPGHTMCYSCYTRAQAVMPIVTCGVCAQPEAPASVRRFPLDMIRQLVDASNTDNDRLHMMVGALAQLARQAGITEARTELNGNMLANFVQALAGVERNQATVEGVLPQVMERQTKDGERLAMVLRELARLVEATTGLEQDASVMGLRIQVALTSIHDLMMGRERVDRVFNRLEHQYEDVCVRVARLEALRGCLQSARLDEV